MSENLLQNAGIGVHSAYHGMGAGKVLFDSLCEGLSQLGAEYK
ncbi:hypothetical protein QBE55_08350 [Eubacteriales bacterium mix99]|jgi:hypothetical protein